MIRCSARACYYNDEGYCYDAYVNSEGYCEKFKEDSSKCPQCGAYLLAVKGEKLEYQGTPCNEEYLKCPWGCDN